MAILYITEYKEIASAESALQVPQEPALAVQTVDFTGVSAPSALLNEETKFVSVQLDADGHIHFDPSAVATAETSRVHKANSVSFHGVPVGGTYKIAAITAV